MKKRVALSILLILTLVIGSFGFAFADQTYTVKSGDCLWNIAKTYNTTYQKLAQHNQIKNPDLIFVDQIIKIPDSKSLSPLLLHRCLRQTHLLMMQQPLIPF